MKNPSDEPNYEKTYISQSEEHGTIITTYGTKDGTTTTYLPPIKPTKIDPTNIDVTDPDRPKDVRYDG
jgi:hypothetical protein